MNNAIEPFEPPCPIGFVKFPTDMCEHFCSYRMTGSERRIFDCIMRKTVGWKKQWDYIPISQFAEECDIRPPNVCRSLNELVKMNAILVKVGRRGGRQYSINFNFREWR